MSFRSRDPIHNFVTLPAELAPIVGCRALQRLRGIRQLALASLVYPGALHTRFDHTLGVAHVAGRMAERLGISGPDLRLVQLAALLHDTGHGPFSHVSEASLDWFGDKSKCGPDQHKIHEAVTAQIILTDPELGALLLPAERENVVQLLGKWKGRPLLKRIISGPLDADKQDYLLRDSYFCGVEYGHYDLAQLHHSLVEVDGDLMIERDGIHAVEQFVLAKYYLTTNVYRHRVRLITDRMITRAIRLGIEKDKNEVLARLYRFDGSPAFVNNYMNWDDARLLETFCPRDAAPPAKKAGRMFQRLRDRCLLKEVFRQPISAFDARHRETLKALPGRDTDAVAKRAERAVAEYLNRELNLTGSAGIDPDFVIAYSYSIKSARETSRNDEQGILVSTATKPEYFTDQSTLFRSINEAYLDSYVVIFAPIVWPDPSQKSALRSRWEQPILNLIQDACKPEKP